MSSALRSLLMVIGPLLIAGATIIFLRGIGDILPPNLLGGLAFAAGLTLLWLAFRPSPAEHVVEGTEFPEPESYDRTALARLQESLEPPRERSESRRRG